MRPIACSGVLRRLLSSIIARKASSIVSSKLVELRQYGVGVPSGVEHVAMQTRGWHELGGTVLQLNCRNAFNSVDRKAIVEALQRFQLSQLLPFFTAMYLGDTLPELRADKRKADGAADDSSYIILSQLGVQQGDPLGPLLYALAQTHALHPPAASDSASDSSSSNSTSSSGEADVIAPHSGYLDDLNALLNTHIDEAVMQQVHLIVKRLASIGLEINPEKSLYVAKRGYTFTAAERALISSLHIPFVDASEEAEKCGFVTVGVPVGSPE
jgi:Reverse transcriptase (RNA-dependent DNA polymerase)